MLVNCSKGIELDVPVGRLPPAAMDHIVKIGLRNILQDAHAGVKDPAKAREKSEGKLAALIRGEIRTASPIRAASPDEKIALAEAIAEVWRTRLEDLSKLKASKRDAEARKLARELIAQRSATKPARRKAA